MNKFSLTRLTLYLGIIVLWASGCAVIPRCPSLLLPLVETEINVSLGSEDDYLTTSVNTACRARILNYGSASSHQFPGGVQVEVRNIPGSSALLFSTSSGGAGSASIFVTLPENGDYLPFFVKGTATTPVDKTAVIEIATAGVDCGEVVLNRTGSMVTASPPIVLSGSSQRVQVIIGANTCELDDYVTWAPTSCAIKWLNPTSPGATLNVTLQNMAGTSRLRFADNTLSGGNTATNSTLNVTLTGDTWTSFYLAGNYPNTSTNDKDAVIEVRGPGSTLLSRNAAMVRIRKNANNISADERDRYLNALKKLNLTYNSYVDFVKTHSRDVAVGVQSMISHRQAHVGSSFFPWHRAFITHIERLLQAVDPGVALPYWRFDLDAPNIFNADFLGVNSAGNMATLSGSNPIVSWSLAGEGVPVGIQRKTTYLGPGGGHPSGTNESTTLGRGPNYTNFKPMEANEHASAHSQSGSTSWLGGNPSIATRDPLFFFLHSNVDRLWAKWQSINDRHTWTDVNSYDLQGSHAAPAAGVATPDYALDGAGKITINRTLGQYADDTMWPWDNVTGGTGTAQRPSVAVLTPFPITLGAFLPFSKPMIKSVIDYLSITGTSPGNGMGFGYDDFTPY